MSSSQNLIILIEYSKTFLYYWITIKLINEKEKEILWNLNCEIVILVS